MSRELRIRNKMQGPPQLLLAELCCECSFILHNLLILKSKPVCMSSALKNLAGSGGGQADTGFL